MVRLHDAPESRCPPVAGRLSIGALAAATAAAADPFKAIVSFLLRRSGRPEHFGELAACDHAAVCLGEEQIFKGCEVGDSDVVSAGAITNAAFMSCSGSPAWQGIFVCSNRTIST